MKQQFTIRTILLLFFIVGYCLGLKAQQYTIAVEANPSNGGSVYVGDQPGTTQGTYVNGQQCTVHAIPAVGYTFMVWRENGTQVSTQASYTFTVTNNRTLVANFQAQTYTISATADPTDGGSVSGGGTYNFGQSCTLAATPAIGYAFLKWTKNGTQVSTSATYTFTVTESAAYVAHFSILVTPPTVTTNAVTNATQTTATCGGNVTSDGGTSVTARGVCWSTSQNPTIADSHTTDGTGTGVFTSYITGLSSNTTYYVRAYATNSEGTAYGEQRTFTTMLSVSAPTVTTNTVTNVTQTTATCGGTVTSDGGANVTARGVCWSTSQNPTIANSHTTDGTGTGVFTSYITGLSSNTTYYVRAYATNSEGTAYGNQRTFTTGQSVTVPTVTTNTVTNVTQTTATCGGNVTSDGGANVTARGVCWSTSQNPTIANSHTTDGTGTGVFTSYITGLSSNTTYYVRAYATNSAGTAYGNQRSFTTLQSVTVPTVTTNTVTNVTQTTATCGGNVTSDGGASVTARGVCWSTSQNPTIANSHTTDGTGTGSFTSSIDGLSPNTTYYVRAYATNSAGTAYGNQRSFTTNLQTYTISVSASPSNGGTVTGGGQYQQGQQCTVSASANSGYAFTNWTENGNVVTDQTDYSFTVNNNRTLVAHFVRQYTINVSANPTNGGSVTGGGTYNQGDYCTVIATANEGFAFTNWTENDSVVSINANYTFTVNCDRILVANFSEMQPDEYNIQVSPNPSNGGMVNGGGIYNDGDECTVLATANDGFKFSKWMENGDVVSTEARYTFTVERNRTLVAMFEQQSYTITVTSNPEDGGTVTGWGTYAYGATCILRAMPNSGYQFNNWKKDGVVVSDFEEYSFEVTADATYTAYFSEIPAITYTITTEVTPVGAGEVTGGGQYEAGTSVELTAIANEGYRFSHWQDDNTDNPRTITVTGDDVFTAYFTQTYVIIASSGPNGSISPKGDVFVEPGESITFTIVPDDGCSIEKVIIDGNDYAPIGSVTFSNVDCDHTIHVLFSGVGIEENESPLVKISPNPVTGMALVECCGMRRITLYNLSGIVVYDMETHNDSESIFLDKLSAGMYLMKVTVEGNRCLYSKLIISE